MITVVKLAARGDLLLAAPAFQHLRNRRPDEHIRLVVGRSCRDVAEHLPFFDEIRAIDDAALFGRTVPDRLRGAREMFGALRAGDGPGTVMILHRDWRYTLLAWLARASERRGFDSGISRWFLTHTVGTQPGEHHTLQYLRVVADELAADFQPEPLWRFAPGERSRAIEKAERLGFRPCGRPVVALGFGGGHNVKMAVDLKRWPLESYRELARRLTGEGCDVVWLGDAADASRLAGGAPGLTLAGELTVPETAAVLSACDLAIANDTMLLHMAGAVGVGALGIFGPTDPAHTRPLAAGSDYLWLGPAEIPCAPCHRDGYYPPCVFEHRCMRSLGVERVLDRARALLAPRVDTESVRHAFS